MTGLGTIGEWGTPVMAGSTNASSELIVPSVVLAASSSVLTSAIEPSLGRGDVAFFLLPAALNPCEPSVTVDVANDCLGGRLDGSRTTDTDDRTRGLGAEGGAYSPTRCRSATDRRSTEEAGPNAALGKVGRAAPKNNVIIDVGSNVTMAQWGPATRNDGRMPTMAITLTIPSLQAAESVDGPSSRPFPL